MDELTRRYSDQEFAVILRTAAELQVEGRAAAGGGLTLAEIKQIAGESGIDPASIDRALAQIDTVGTERSSSGTVHLTTSVPGEISADDLGRLRDVIRRALGQKARGTTEEVLDSLEWRSNPGDGPARHVAVTPRDGQTRIELHTSLVNPQAGWIGGLAVAGFVVGVLAAVGVREAGLISGGLAMMTGLIGGPTIGGLIGARLWKRLYPAARAKEEAAMERLRRGAAELARPVEPTAESAEPIAPLE